MIGKVKKLPPKVPIYWPVPGKLQSLKTERKRKQESSLGGINFDKQSLRPVRRYRGS